MASTESSERSIADKADSKSGGRKAKSNEARSGHNAERRERKARKEKIPRAHPSEDSSSATVANSSNSEQQIAAHFSTAEICTWLTLRGMAEYCDSFQQHAITGESMLELDKSDLAAMGISKIGKLRLLNRCDCIELSGHVKLLLKAIADSKPNSKPRGRAEAMSRQQKQKHKEHESARSLKLGPVDWTQLPFAALARCLLFCGDHYTVINVQSACKPWRAIRAATLEDVYQQCYLNAFERASATETVIAARETWKERLVARQAIDSNWRAGKFRAFLLTLRDDLSPLNIVIPQRDVALILSSSQLAIFKLTLENMQLTVVPGWELPSGFVPSLAATDETALSPVVAFASYQNHELRVFDVDTGRQLGPTFTATKSINALAVNARAQLVAFSTDEKIRVCRYRKEDAVLQAPSDAVLASDIELKESGRCLFDPSGSHLFVLSKSGGVVLADLATANPSPAGKPGKLRRIRLREWSGGKHGVPSTALFDAARDRLLFVDGTQLFVWSNATRSRSVADRIAKPVPGALGQQIAVTTGRRLIAFNNQGLRMCDADSIESKDPVWTSLTLPPTISLGGHLQCSWRALLQFQPRHIAVLDFGETKHEKTDGKADRKAEGKHTSAAADSTVLEERSNDSKASSQRRGWSSLPSVLLAHALSWLGEVKPVVAALSTCKLWARAQAKTDPVWKQLYLRDFEPDSLNHDCVAVDGDNTGFHKRYHARVAIERRWQSNKCIVYMAQTQIAFHSSSAICSELALLVFSENNRIRLFDLVQRKELRWWTATAETVDWTIAQLSLDQTRLASVTCGGEVSVWDISGAEEKQLARFKTELRYREWEVREFRRSAQQQNFALHDDHVFHLDSQLRFLRVWHWRSGERTSQVYFTANRIPQTIIPLGPSSAFVQSNSNNTHDVELYEFAAVGWVKRKAGLELSQELVLQRDPRARDRLLLHTRNSIISWAANEPPPRTPRTIECALLPRFPRAVRRAYGHVKPNDRLDENYWVGATPLLPDPVPSRRRIAEHESAVLDFRFFVRIQTYPHSTGCWVHVHDFGHALEDLPLVRVRRV